MRRFLSLPWGASRPRPVRRTLVHLLLGRRFLLDIPHQEVPLVSALLLSGRPARGLPVAFELIVILWALTLRLKVGERNSPGLLKPPTGARGVVALDGKRYVYAR